MNSELQQFLDVHPNYASIDAALNVSIGVSNRLLERLRELDDSSNQPIAADRVENDEMDQDFVSAYPDPSLPTAPQTGVPQPPPRHTHPSSNPFQQFSDASLGGYPREEHDSAAHDHAAQHPLMSHGTIDNGNAQPLNSQVAAGGSGATGFDVRSPETTRSNEERAHRPQFDSVLPDAVLAIQYQLPYDSLWLHKLGVPLNKLAEFSEVWRCKQKFEDMCRLGAIAVGDEFAVLCYDATGGQQWRYAKVCFYCLSSHPIFLMTDATLPCYR